MLLRRHRGFTLIELLIVVAIIGILAGILLPALGAVKERARQGTCKSTISNFTTALEGYKEDWGEYAPDGGGSLNTGLVIYLDGDTANGGPRTPYFSFDLEQVTGNTYMGPWGVAYNYDELESENLGARVGSVGGDPRASKISIHSFDIWCEHDSDPPGEWPTSYRSN